MAVTPEVIAIAILGMATTLIVLPKRRKLGYTFYMMLAAFVMVQMIDTRSLSFNLPSINVSNIDVGVVVPIALVFALLGAIVLVTKQEQGE